MTRGAGVTGDADNRLPQRWFVGVTTVPTRRATQVGRSGRPVVVGWLPTVDLVGKFVTEHSVRVGLLQNEPPPPPCGVIGNAGWHEWRRAYVMVVAPLQRAEEILLAGDMPCPRCQGVLRPFGTGRTRIVRGLGGGHRDRDPAAGPLR